MDNNLLSEIQNEISIIGFDKLKEIHFGADRSSGSESGENDVLDDEYYKNQPPAHSYDFIKDHVVKVNQRPRIQQIRKPYNRSNEFRRRAEPRRNWKSERSGPNADQVLQRDSTVSFGRHALPAPIKELGSSSSSSSNHISNWIVNSSINQEAVGSVIGSTPQRVFPIHSPVFNRSDFITEDRHFSDAINKNALSPTSGPSSRTISPPSNAIRPVLHDFEKPPSSYNHSTHFSNKNIIEANDEHSRIRHSSQSGGFAEKKVVHNSYLPNHLEKMTDLKGSLPAPSSVKQQILSVDQILSTYRQIGMDSNNIIQSNPNTQRQLPLEQCHTSGGNHSISKRLSDDLLSGQKEQKLVKKVTTSNLSESRIAATLASDEICKKTTKDVVQDATKLRKGSSTSTTKAHGHVGNNSCSESRLHQPTYPTFTDKSEGARSSLGRQALETVNGVQSNIDEGTIVEQPPSTDAQNAFPRKATTPQPTYPTFTDKSEAVRSSVGRQASQNSKGVQSHVHEGTITGQPLPIDTREKFLRCIEKTYPREVRTIGWREFRRETVLVGTENTREEPAKAPTQINEPIQTGIISWLRRILCCARDKPYEPI